MIAHKSKSQDINTVQDLQTFDEIQKIGFIHIVDGQAGQGGPGNYMVHGTLGVSDKASYAGHGITPRDIWWVMTS